MLLKYRTAQIESELRSAELLMGRKFSIMLPMLDCKLKPLSVDDEKYRHWNSNYRKNSFNNKKFRDVTNSRLSGEQRVFILDKFSEYVILAEARLLNTEIFNRIYKRKSTMLEPFCAF